MYIVFKFPYDSLATSKSIPYASNFYHQCLRGWIWGVGAWSSTFILMTYSIWVCGFVLTSQSHRPWDFVRFPTTTFYHVSNFSTNFNRQQTCSLEHLTDQAICLHLAIRQLTSSFTMMMLFPQESMSNVMKSLQFLWSKSLFNFRSKLFSVWGIEAPLKLKYS